MLDGAVRDFSKSRIQKYPGHVRFGSEADICCGSKVLMRCINCRSTGRRVRALSVDGQTDLFGGLQVDNEFEFGGLLDRNITRLRFARPLLECLWSAGAPYDTRPPLSTR